MKLEINLEQTEIEQVHFLQAYFEDNCKCGKEHTLDHVVKCAITATAIQLMNVMQEEDEIMRLSGYLATALSKSGGPMAEVGDLLGKVIAATHATDSVDRILYDARVETVADTSPREGDKEA